MGCELLEARVQPEVQVELAIERPSSTAQRIKSSSASHVKHLRGSFSTQPPNLPDTAPFLVLAAVTMSVDEAAVKSAVRARKAYIIENLK
mgnify:CR=1 FL=1